MTVPEPDPALVRDVRRALAHLDDLPRLQTSPLAAAPPPGLTAGADLRRRLTDAVDQLSATGGRVGTVLALRHLERLSPGEICARLAIGRSELYRCLAAGDAAVADILKASSTGLVGLPAPRTRFVGRGAELALARDLLARERLVTMVGPGGAGKTRLAVEIARNHDSAARVWLVDLAPPETASRAYETILTVIGGGGVDGDAASRVVARLRRERGVLILDNCDRLVEAVAPLAARILDGCRGMRILATSREALRVAGEHLVPIGPLDQGDAIRLFVDRAAAVAPGMELDLALVAEIVQHVDCLPLAIELAAASSRQSSLQEIRDGLVAGLTRLGPGSRDAPERHASIEASIAWSYHLLDPSSRRVFRRLGVFAGEWPLDAVDTVCGRGAATRVATLVDRSLIVAIHPSAGTRYRLLETLRTFALARLREAGELARVRHAHVRWCLALARATPSRQLEPAHHDLMSALAWSAERRERAGSMMELVLALDTFWHGHPAEGRGWMEAALARSAEATPEERIEALHWAGHLATMQGAFESAIAHLRESVALARATGPSARLTTPLRRLAFNLWLTGEEDEARVLAAESVEIARRHGPPAMVPWCLVMLARATWRLSPSEAERLWREAIDEATRVDERPAQATATGDLGKSAAAAGRLDEAAGFADEAICLSREVRAVETLTAALGLRGAIARRQDDQPLARTLLCEAVEVGRRNQPVLRNALRELGCLYIDAGEVERGVRLFACGNSGRGVAMRNWFVGVLVASAEEVAAAVGDRLPEGRFRALLAEGAAMALDEAIELALQSPSVRGRLRPYPTPS